MSQPDNRWSYGGQAGYLQNQPAYTGSTQHTNADRAGPVFNPQTGQQNRFYTPAEGWKEFFGEPRGKLEPRRQDDLEYELYDLPHAYTGKNSYLSQIVINRVTEDQQWILREFAPWQKFENAMTITWDKWTFNDHMLGRTPEEAISRLLTSKVSSESTNFTRYGIALMLEHGFFNTEKGRMHYAMNIKQIQNAIVETAAFGAMTQAYNIEMWKDPNEKYRKGGVRNQSQLDNFFAQEIEDWAIVQKTDDGTENVISKMATAMQERNNIEPNLFCGPQGMKKYIELRTVNLPFAQTGLKPGETKDLLANTLARHPELRYRESRSFRRGEHQPAEDPAYRERTIGSFFQMDMNHLRGIDPKEYRTHMLDTVLYDETADSMVPFGFAENFRYTGLFDHFNYTEFPKQSKLGRNYFAGYDNWGKFIEEAVDRGTNHVKSFIIQGILNKSADVQSRFVHAMLGGVNLARPTVGPPQVASNGRFHGSGQSGVSGSATTTTKSAAASLPKRVKSFQVKEFITKNNSDRFRLNEEQFRQISAFIDTLEEIDENDFSGESRLVEKAYQTLHRSTFSVENVYLNLLGELSEDLLKSDLNQALVHVRGESNVSETQLELAADLTWATNNSAASALLSTADSRSPLWRIINTISNGHRPNLALYDGLGRPTKNLDYHSQILTLTSSNVALIRLPPVVLNNLKTRHGLINLDYSSVPDSDQLKQDTLRAGLLQYSVSTSAVYESFKKFADEYDKIKGSDPTAAEARKALITSVFNELTNELLTNEHPLTQIPEDYQEVVAYAHSLPILNTQQNLKAIIELCRFVVNAFCTDQWNINLLVECLLSFNNHYNNLYSSSNASIEHNKQAASGSRVQLVTPFSNKTTDILLSALGGGGNVDVNFAYDEAVQVTEELHRALEKKNAGDTYLDSFPAFRESYIQLYQVTKARGLSLESWKKNIQVLQNWYRTKCGSGQAINVIQLALNELFANIADGKDNDVFKVAEDFARFEAQSAESEAVVKNLREVFKNRLQYHYRQHYSVSSVDSTQTAARAANKEFYDHPELAAGADPRIQAALRVYDGRKTNPSSYSPFNDRQLDIIVAGAQSSVDIRTQATVEGVCLAEHFKSRGSYEVLEVLRRGANSDEVYKAAFMQFSKSPEIIFKQVIAKWGLLVKNPSTQQQQASDDAVAENVKESLKLTEKQIDELLHTPGNLNGAFIRFCLENDVLPCLGMNGLLPHGVYLMGDGFMAQAGGMSASTLFGHANMEVADDAARKVHYAHFTMYSKTVIWAKERVMVQRNMFCKDYLGGMGSKVWDPLDPTDLDAYQDSEIRRDIFLVPKPIAIHTNQAHQDITMSYHKDLSASADVQRETRLPRAEFWVRYWGWDSHQRNPGDIRRWNDAIPKQNTVVFQAHQGLYDHATKKHSTIVTNKGHWGPNVYPGCGKTRKGGQGRRTFLHCDYSGLGNVYQMVK